MHQRFAVQALEATALLVQELRQQEHLFAQPPSPFVVREEIQQFVAEGRDTGRLETDHRRARIDGPGQHLHAVLEAAASGIQHAEVVERPSAAHEAARHLDLETGRIQHLRRGIQRLRMEMVVERIRPQHHLGASRSIPSLGAEAAIERASKAGNAALRRYASDRLEQAGYAGRASQRVDQPGHAPGDPRPLVDQADGIGLQRTSVMLVVVVQELSLVAGHVDLHRTFRATALARQAQVQRFLDE